MSSLSRRFIINFVWQIFGQFGYYIILLIGNIVLARLLDPYEFGVIGILTFFLSVSRVFTEAGLSGALIRKGNPSDEDYSTIFLFNLNISVVCYLILYFIAPYIADFYENEEFALYLRVVGIILIINAFQFTQSTRLVVQLQYKKVSFYSIIAAIISTVVGICLAIFKYGVWALIWMQILNSFVLTITYWIGEGGFKKIVFKKESFFSMYRFGMFTTLSSILDAAFQNIYQIFLGKYFSISITGYYFQGKKLQEIPVGIIRNVSYGVVYSTLSKLKDDQKKFSNAYTSVVILFTSLVGLICINLYIFAKDILVVLYGAKWIESTFYIRVLSLASFFYMQEVFNRNIFKVFDKTHRIFILEIIKKIIQSVSIVIVALYFLDIRILLYTFVGTSAISFVINYWESRKIFSNENGAFLEFKVVAKVLGILTFFVVLGDYFIQEIDISSLLKIVIFLPLVILTYIALLHILNVFKLQTILIMLKNLKKK